MTKNHWITLSDVDVGGPAKYRTITDIIAKAIESGALHSGEKLPPHRCLAKQIRVTAGTVSRAYAELERKGLVNARVGDGTYVNSISGDSREKARKSALSEWLDFTQNITIPTEEGEALQRTLHQIASDPATCGELMRYQSELGIARHRAVGAGWLTRFGFQGNSECVMIVNGGQHAIATILRTITRPGDVIMAENLSYSCFAALAQQFRLKAVGVEIDEQGMLPSALERTARAMNGRLVFCIPTLHSPTVRTMSQERRQQIAAVIRAHDMTLIEDSVQAALLPHPPRAVSALIPERSFFVTSFSKSIGAGLRVGFIEAPSNWLGRIATTVRSDCWMSSPISAEIACRWAASGEAERLAQLQRAQVAERQTIALEYLYDLPHTMARDCPQIWLPLPRGTQADTVANALRRSNVFVKSSNLYAVGSLPAPPAIRINLSAPHDTDRLRKGLRKIRTLLGQGLSEHRAA